jgi:hypothetical protein
VASPTNIGDARLTVRALEKVKNEMVIGDGLTQGTYAKVALLENIKLGVD